MGKNLHLEKLDRLLEPANHLAMAMITEANKQGIYVCVVAGERTNAEQAKLYAQGRTAPGKKVTNAGPGNSIHNYRLAWDLCPIINNKLVWGRIDLFNKLGAIAKKLGITWGGTFRSIVDKPHFQATGGLTLSQLKSGKRPPQTIIKPKEDKPVGDYQRFTDVPKTHAMYNEIEKVAAAGIMVGYPNNTFGPNRPATRAELAKVVVAILGKK